MHTLITIKAATPNENKNRKRLPLLENTPSEVIKAKLNHKKPKKH